MRTQTERKMRSTRIGQNKLKKCMKWTASGLLLAVMFVLVFAGTLSGAFGIEENLQQNGIIENNVASADGAVASTTIDLSDTFKNTASSININPDVSKKGRIWSTSSDHTTNNTWTPGDATTGGQWYIGNNDSHLGSDYANVWFVYDLGANYKNKVYGDMTVSITATYKAWDGAGIVAIESGDSLTAAPTDSGKAREWYENVRDGKLNTISWKSTGEMKKTSGGTAAVNLSLTVAGRYIRIHYATWDGSGKYNEQRLDSVKVTLTRALAYKIEYNKNASDSTGTVSDTSHKFMADSNISSDFYVGNRQYFTEWNTSADGNGVRMAIGASTGTSTAANTFGSIVKSNLEAGNTTTTLYAQYVGISFVFNRQSYSIYNNEVLQVLQGKSGYLTSTVDSTFTSTITYKNSSNSTISEPTSIGVYTATITVTKDGKTRGSVTLPFEIIEGDFGKLDGASGKWGSFSNPYVIKNATHLQNLSRIVNSDTPGTQAALNSIVGSDNGAVTADQVVAVDNKFANCYFVISANIGSAGAPVSLTPIGRNATNCFAGTIYGAGNSIKIIYLNINQGGESNVGLFGYTNGASISYIKTDGSIVGGESTGGIVGCAEYTEIFNCSNSAAVTGSTHTGGIVGYGLHGTNCKIYGDVTNSGTVTGTTYVGGIIGRWHGVWKNGSGTYGTFVNSGAITGSSASIGGIAGFTDGEIRNAINEGKVLGGNAVGGIAGRTQNNIANSYNIGNIIGTSAVTQGEISGNPNGVFVGGITGYTMAGDIISHCYNEGTISGTTANASYINNGNYVGGIVGYAQATVEHCANIGGLIDGNDYIGGIVGNSSSTISDCYDVQGQRKYRYDTGHIGAISGFGGTVENSWAVNELPVVTTASNPQAIVSTLGRKLVTAFTVTPIVIQGGETEVDWTSILSQNINGFKISTSVTSGNYLKLSDNKGTAVLPYKVGNGYTAQNSTSSTAITQGNISCDVYYNATTSNDIYAQAEQIGIDVASKVYNAYAQQVGGFKLPTGYEALATFYFERDINGNPTGTPTINKTNAGTYVVISDAKIKVGSATYVVGRKQANWTITPLYLRVSNATFNYGVNVEKQLQNNIVISATSGGTALTSHTFSVDIDSSAHNFYKSIPSTSGQNTFAIASDKITVKNGDNIVTGNFVITGFEVVIKEGDFGVENSGINKNNINTNKWGSPNNPYIIRTLAQIQRLSSIVRGTNAVNSIRTGLYEYVTATGNTYSGAYFKLAASLSAGNITPIGTNTAVFSGTFDGNGNTIALSINVAGSYVGLFGYTSGATIQNLTISGSVKGSKYVGGVVGYALNTTIYNVTNNATVTARYSTDNDAGGSIIQYDGGNVSSEGFDKVFDGNTGTKFCGNQNSAMSFVADLGSKVAVSGFAICNGNDTTSVSNRRPKVVRIWGTNSQGSWPTQNYNGKANAGNTPEGKDYSGNWTIVFDSSNINIPIDNYARHEYAFTNNKTYKYQYYWVYISSVGHVQGSNASAANVIQFSEFDFLAAGEDAGGVVGYASGTDNDGTIISNVRNNASVTGSNYTGGIVGRANGIFAITDSANAGGIMGFDGTAGVLGAMTNNANVTITSCQNGGTVSSSPESNGVAGIIGRTETASNKLIVQGCKNTAGITGDRNVGGIGGRIETTRNAKDSLVFANCYNEGSIAATKYGTVGGIAGYLFANGTSINDVATISYCFSSGAVSTNNTDSNKNIGGIVGNPNATDKKSARVYNCYTTNTSYAISGTQNATIDNTNYVIASGASAPSTTNGGKYLVYNSAFTFKPAIISGSAYTPYDSWTVIAEYVNATENGENVRVFNKINGFMVSGNIAPSSSQYFLSKTGVSSAYYLTPSKVENSNPTNAANRSNTETFTITAWYGANTQSDIYCTISTVTIDDSRNNIYSGQQQGFERSAVSNPNTNNSVYGVVFDYLLTSPSEHFVKTFAFDSNGNLKESGNNPYQVGAYNTTVFVKIGDVIVGKRVNRVFEIKQETINLSWEWTDDKQNAMFDRTGTGAGIQFIFNLAEQGLKKVEFKKATNNADAFSLFTSTGNLKYIDANNTSTPKYFRTYTLSDTRNYKIYLQNATLNLSGATVTFQWIIRKNKLTIENRWVRADFGKDSTYYTFEYNAAHQGLLATDGITFIVEPDTVGTGNRHDPIATGTNAAYRIDGHADTINVGSYSRSIYLNDQDNYEISYTKSYVGNSNTALSSNKGVSVNGTQSVTYSWQILAYNILDNFDSDSSKTKVWFGGIAGDNGLIVGNQLPSVISGTTRGGNSVNVNHYPLQSASSGVQQVLVYGQNTTEVQRYLPTNFIIYVQYNDGKIAQLVSGNEYTLSNLEAPTAADPTPINTSVTASGRGNFAGNLSKYYTVLYSDFGWKSGKNPNSANWGTKDNPYVIDRPEYLLRLSQIVNGKDKAWNSIASTAYCYAPQSTATAQNATYNGAYFLVTANIDMSAYVSTDGLTNFLPIGNSADRVFKATFEGGNNEIKYIYNIGYFVNKANPSGEAKFDYIGLFGYTDGATIQNLTVKSERAVSVSVGGVTYKGGIHGRDYVGGIVGKAVNSTIKNVKFEYGDCVYGNDYVGGIVGFAQNTTIANPQKMFNASVSGRFYVGGIAGEWQVYEKSQLGLDNQQSLTPIDSSTVSGYKYVGGLVGWLDLSKCSGSVTFTPQYKGTTKSLEVQGTEYVGALFGTIIGNGYRQTANSTGLTSIVVESSKVGNVTLKPVPYSDGNSTYLPKVVGGLVGYIESAALVFGTGWNTSNVTFDFNKTSTSFLGGVIGVMGKNSTIEMLVVNKNDGSPLTPVDGKIVNDTPFGSRAYNAAYNAGSFVGGIVGYVSSQAGSFWGEGTTIFGNAVQLENTANIYATGFAGGIFGALGNIALKKIDQSVGAVYNEIAVEKNQNQENRTNILQKILVGGVREGSSVTTLGIAPTTDSDYGKLINTASVHVSKTNDGSNYVSGEYVGGIVGYSGANVRLVLRNKPQTGDIDVSAFNVYSGGVNVFFAGSYAGGIAGFTDNLAHELQYIVVQAKFTDSNATRVGGLIGEMMSGSIDGCVVASADSTDISYETDNFKGTEYVGGLVGRTENASIRNSVATGFKLTSTSITKGGVLGGGTNPTIEASWTFYIANEGATFSIVSANGYGKYIIVDTNTIISNGSSYPSFEKLCAFAGIANTATEGAVGVLEFVIKVPAQRQLAFYDASGSDKETTNKESFVGFKNENTNLTIKLDMETGTSMQICLVDVEFVNIPQNDTSNDDKAKKLVEERYKKPSSGTRYYVEVTEALFDVGNTRQVTKISANVYFDYKGDGTYLVSVGASSKKEYNGEYKIGDYTAELVPGSEGNPFTISTQEEWNDFAYSVYKGTNSYGKYRDNCSTCQNDETYYHKQYVKLLTDIIVIDNSAHYGTASSTVPLDFGTKVTSTPANGTGAGSNIGYNFAGDISKDSNVNNFQGVFDGNGHYITINYNSGGYYRVSVFPNAANAEFRNLTIKGKIQAASQMTGANGISGSAAYDIAGFVGKPFGALEFYHCTNEANIIGLRNVAGIVGYNAGGHGIKLEACVNTGNITSLQGMYTVSGGFKDTYKYNDNLQDTGVGVNNISFTFGTGGIIGAYTGNITIESCRNAGTIIGGHNVGGIIGLHDGTSSAKATLAIQNCANTGNVTSNSGYWGEDEGRIGGAASEGVRQYVFGYAGGLVGLTSQFSILEMYASYNTGDVTTYSNMAGGLVGSVGAMHQPKDAKNSVKTGGRSTIAYCYNTGNVRSGGTFPKRTQNYSGGREHYGGSVVGGLVGLVGDIQISQSYNAGDVWQFGIIAYGGSWQVRAGGIVGQSQPTSGGYVLIDNVYNIGTVNVRSINTVVGWGEGVYSLQADARYGAAISGYCDISDDSNRIKVADCYSINNCVSSKIAKDIAGDNEYIRFKNGTNEWYDERFDEWYKNEGVAGIGGAQVALIETGRVYDTYDALTAAMDENSRLRMTGSNFAFDQSTTAITLNYGSVGNYTSINEQILNKDKNNITSITEQAVSNLAAIKWKAFPDSWLYVYGCLPQLSMFALDTQNGLSMRSVGYGKDDYGTYNKTAASAGSKQYPYIIKDGIDLMGMQALVDAGYSFEGKYIEVADGTNTLDKLASKQIQLATYNSTDTAAVNDASNAMYKAVDQNGAYRVGKSYHLLLQGAIFNKARNKNGTYVGTDYSNWAWNTYYYNGETLSNVWESGSPNPNKWDSYGSMRHYGVFSLQNFIPMGRGSSVFKGHFSGKQANDENTTIDDVRITTGKYGATTEYGSEYGGLFAKVQDAYIGYISIGGSSKILSFTKENDISACGGIVGLSLGSSVIDNCGVSDSAAIGAYGVSKTNQYVANESIANDKKYAKDTYAGGIVGLANPKQGNSYNAGITTTIRNCTVNTSGNIESAKNNIGGVLGYVEGLSNAEGKGNSVRIENCNVQKAILQATASATTSGYIGGVLGFGSQYVSAFVTDCKVGVDGNVTIAGEHSLGGIAGGMSNAQGGYIDSCTVGGGTSITRINNQGGDKQDKQVAESADHGTAIGGLVGFTQNSADTVSPLTTTFSGTSLFAGTITVGVAATNKSADSDAAISQIGGIVGDMGSGANFASGSDVTVRGTISIPLEAANVGGVAGRTNTATFIGKFDVRPNMSTANAENVGGFIGKNIGTVYILADNTDKLVDGELKGTQIEIGGTIVGTNEVGGFIGVNNSGSSLNIGSNVAYAKPYRSGTLNVTITATVTSSGNNVGGIVGKNEGSSGATDYATIDIVKGVILQQGNIQGKNYVGGIIGLNQGLLTTGGGEADTAINGATLSTEQINSIKNLSITNNGTVKGGASNGTIYENGDYVGGVIGYIDSPSELRATDEGKGAIAGTFTNTGTVEGGRFVGGSIGFVGKNVTINAKDTDTLFVNKGSVKAHGYFAGGSIGALVGTIEGTKEYLVKFKNEGNVDATGFVGGSIGVLAGPVKFAQFVNKSNGLTINAVNSVGGSVGYIGIPTPFKTELDKLNITIPSDYVQIVNTHFEAKGNLIVNATQTAINEAKGNASDSPTGWGGVGGAIGVIGANVAKWGSSDAERNTYYANGNVVASGINNVGGIVGLINASNITISNMLAYDTKVEGGENVGGIVGATTGNKTVIKSAFAVSSSDEKGVFKGDKNVGGIIGLSKSDTDAKSSYWVKGYPNATLAGTDVGTLQTDLGKFETIVEYVGSQPVVFTEEFCEMYTPKTYYDDYTGTHKYKDTTIATVTDEQLTWEEYFESSLGITNAVKKNGAWVSPIPNAKSYTTGAENTGWYFVYATDKTIGTISAEHSVNANESYWKRIADAYTAGEREAGKDKETLPASAIVLGNNGQPQKSTLYATATSAGENSGYYLYMATSGNSRPSATYSSGKFFIETLTASEDSLAENVAVYYRTISRGKSLTYNGYARFAPVAITASADVDVPFIAEPVKDTTKADSYCYSSDTSADSTQTKPNTANPYKSKVKIYYFDSVGTPHVVGGVEIDWEIRKRDLEASLSVPSGTLTYGDPDINAVLTVENIAPADGNGYGADGYIRFDIIIKDADGKEIAKFTWNGNAFTNQSADGKVVSNNVTVSDGGFEIGNKLSGDDLLFNVEDIANLDTDTRTFSCRINFKDAKTYKVSVVTPNMDGKYNPSPIVEDQTITVNPATLTLKRTSVASHYFDNTDTSKGATWTVSGFKFNDGEAQFAAFEPVFVMALGRLNGTKEITETAMQNNGVLVNPVRIGNLIQINFGVSDGTNGKTLMFDLSGVSKVGDYYIKTAGGKGYRVGNYTLTYEGTSAPTYSINENKITISGTTNATNGTHQYDGSTKGTITLTFAADKNIVNLGQFVEQFFAASINNGGTVKTKPSDSTSSGTVTWVFETGINAKEYTVTLTKGDGYEEAAKSCAHLPSVLPKTYRYEITKRPLTVEFAQMGNSPYQYEYSTYHQGLSTVKISNLCQVGSVWDSVNITLYVGDNSYTVSSNRNNAVDVKNLVSTINVGTYIATISASLSGTSSGNYYISNTDVRTSWTIKKHKLTLSGLKQDDGKIYDGTPVTPALKVNGSDISNGEITYGADTIKINYSATVDGVTTDKIVNAGTYTIGIGGNATDAIIATRGSENTTQNYEIDGTDEATYTIQPRQIKLTWDTATFFVFSNAEQGLIVKGVEGVSEGGKGQLAVSSSTITEARIKGYAGNDTIIITVSGAKVHVADSKNSIMTAVISNVTGTNADGSNSSLKNYEIVEGTTSGEFEITPSVVSVRFTATNATLEKTYDGNDRVTAQIPDSYFELSATGDIPMKFPFTISGTYDDENVLYDSSNNVIRGKAVTFSYTFSDPTNVGDYTGGSVDTAAYNVGKITPKHIQVFLDKLRSNKATRTYTNDPTYGGSGVSGNGTTTPYRAGEGFRVSGVLTGDVVTISANYAESDNLRNTNANGGFDFSKYVNDVYKDADGTFKKATSGTYLKKLVFEMNGADAGNYTFNVYHSNDGAYSESDGNFATKVTVYDSREKDQTRQNKSNSPQIQIEITVKSVKVEYQNAAQSYANDDNTYNTNWAPVTGTNKETDKAGADIIVTNGWMYPDGIDHSNESGYAKREYHGYTVIQGRAGNSRLGASVSTKDGMNLNYRLSNQPTLTIAYFVSTENSNEYKITSLARLLIASFYYTAHQNPQNLDMIKIVSSGYAWVKVVSVDENGAYVGEYKKPDNSPITDSKAKTWDEYLAELQAADYAVFFDTEKSEWGYYSSNESTQNDIPLRFVQTKDITGTFTAQDIEILNAFFTTLSTDANGAVTETHYNWNGTNKDFLTNVLKARVGTNVTIKGSLFVSTATSKVNESDVLTGFDGTYDGKGYVIEYLNIMGYGKTNVGLFDVIGETGIVKNVHLRNVTINANQGNVGMLAGSVYESNTTETSVKNVSVHGAINASGGTVGGLFGTSARDIENAIVLGTITSQNATLGGVVGTTSASVKNVVSLVQITANGGSVNPFTTSSATIENSYHMANAVWQKGSGFANVSGKSKTFNELMSGSVTGYYDKQDMQNTKNKYYYTGETAPTKGTFDVLDDVQLTALSAIGTQNEANARQSMRLRDMVSVYLMMYSLSKTTGTLTSENTFNVNVYAISSSSWLVDSADGTQSKPISVANKQNVSLLRQLPFATFTLKANISIDITSTFAGAFFGIVTSETDNAGNSLGYKITCDKAMFEAYAENNPSWIEVA